MLIKRALISLSVFLCSSFAFGTTHKISQKDKEFQQDGKKIEEIKIKVGDEIDFANDDKTPHNVFSMDKEHKFNLKIQKPNSSTKHKFEKAGPATVRCAIHPKMKLKVIIE